MKIQLLFLVIGLSMALTVQLQVSQPLDPNDIEETNYNVIKQSTAVDIQFVQSHEQSFQESDSNNIQSELMSDSELQNALITTDDLQAIPDISMNAQNALFLQKHFV